MSHVAIIVGLSGCETYLRDGLEVTERKKAQRFRSEGAATTAAKAHIGQFTPVVQRGMAFRVEPADATVQGKAVEEA